MIIYQIVLHALVEWEVGVKVVDEARETYGQLRHAGPVHFSVHDPFGKCLGVLDSIQGITINAGEYITVKVARIGPCDVWNAERGL
jgi:hypothetical protein